MLRLSLDWLMAVLFVVMVWLYFRWLSHNGPGGHTRR